MKKVLFVVFTCILSMCLSAATAKVVMDLAFEQHRAEFHKPAKPALVPHKHKFKRHDHKFKRHSHKLKPHKHKFIPNKAAPHGHDVKPHKHDAKPHKHGAKPHKHKPKHHKHKFKHKRIHYIHVPYRHTFTNRSCHVHFKGHFHRGHVRDGLCYVKQMGTMVGHIRYSQ